MTIVVAFVLNVKKKLIYCAWCFYYIENNYEKNFATLSSSSPPPLSKRRENIFVADYVLNHNRNIILCFLKFVWLLFIIWCFNWQWWTFSLIFFTWMTVRNWETKQELHVITAKVDLLLCMECWISTWLVQRLIYGDISSKTRGSVPENFF